MLTKSKYTEEPVPAVVDTIKGVEGLFDHITVAGNVVKTDDGWEADVNDFWEKHGILNLDDVLVNPYKYLSYITVKDRERLQKEYTDTIQKWMDTEAATHGYDNIHTACSYENSSILKFKAEGQACRLWRDNVWTGCYDYLDKVLIGEEPLISVEELIAKLPQMVWPN